jgi:hypothetical protein
MHICAPICALSSTPQPRQASDHERRRHAVDTIPPVTGQGSGVVPAGRGSVTRYPTVWLGSHPIVSYENEVEAAANFEHEMRRRYPSCQVTNDRVDQETATTAPSGEATVR